MECVRLYFPYTWIYTGLLYFISLDVVFNASTKRNLVSSSSAFYSHYDIGLHRGVSQTSLTMSQYLGEGKRWYNLFF